MNGSFCITLASVTVRNTSRKELKISPSPALKEPEERERRENKYYKNIEERNEACNENVRTKENMAETNK